jgi:hypothetical protein
VGTILARSEDGFRVALGPSEPSSELVDVEVGIAEDAAQGSALELLVKRHDQEGVAIGMSQANMTSSLASDLPANASARGSAARRR